MGAEPSQSQFGNTGCRQQFAVLRSDWLDRFARFEIEVCATLLAHNALKAGSPPFAQRLNDLQNLPSLAEKAPRLLKRLIAERDALLLMRATLVHSAMQVGSLDRQPAAVFRKVTDAVTENPSYVVMAETDFRRTMEQLQSLADKVKSFSKL
jgi:hypothetical protein